MVHDSHSARSRGIGLGSWGSVTFTFVRALLGALAVPAEDGAFLHLLQGSGRGCPCFCSNRQLVCVQETYPYASITSRLPDDVP